MRRNLKFIVAVCVSLFLFTFSLAQAQEANVQLADVPPTDLPVILDKIRQQERVQGLQSKDWTDVQIGEDVAGFPSRAGQLKVMTIFHLKAGLIDKEVQMKQGDQESNPQAKAAFKFTLQKPAGAFHHKVDMKEQRLVFWNDNDVFVYAQYVNTDGTVDLKEWIYTRAPNSLEGSRYQWRLRKAGVWDWPLEIWKDKDGNTGIYRKIPVNGISPDDEQRREHIINSVNTAFKGKVYVPLRTLLAKVPPIIFWDKEGRAYQGGLGRGQRGKSLDVAADAKPDQYPLLIDPGLTMSFPNVLIGNLSQN